MSKRTVILAIEDRLSEAVCERILESRGINVSQRIGFKGKDYLKNKVNSLNQTAQGFPVFMLTDLDSPESCPPRLIQSWIKRNQNPQFFLRVAVMEVESWILADRQGIANFLTIPKYRIPQNTDVIPQPKEFLVSLARLSRRRRVLEEIVPAPGATSQVGPEYNSRLVHFVHNRWNIEVAALISKSLNRTLARLSNFDRLG